MTDFVTGDKELDRRLKLVGQKIAQKAVTAGIRAGLGSLRTSMRREEPNSRVKKVIASRFKRRRKQGQTQAKVGAGVGKHRTAKDSARSRPGVGISKQNAHWYFLGTSIRQTNSGANRGRMPASMAIRRGAQSGQGMAMAKVRAKILKVIEKEVAKLN